MISQVQLTIQIEAVIRGADEEWVAVCPPLDIASQSDSPDAALASLTEAVEAWFESCLDRKVLDQALRECGFQRFVGSSEVATGDPDQSNHRMIRCSVPAYVIDALNEIHAPR